LPDHVLIEVLLQFQRFRELVGSAIGLLVAVILEDAVAYGDALVTNISSRIVAG
jgi:hypothetical protein